jgi:hypothetical protein
MKDIYDSADLVREAEKKKRVREECAAHNRNAKPDAHGYTHYKIPAEDMKWLIPLDQDKP